MRAALPILVALLAAGPAPARQHAPGAVPERGDDPDRRDRDISMGGADYLRALDLTGMRAAVSAPLSAEEAAAGSWQESGPVGGFGPGLTFNGRVAGLRLVDDGSGGYYIYAGASGGGLWRSHSSSPDVWTPMAQTLPNPSIRAFAFDPANSAHIVVCTGDPADRYDGAGIFVTYNGGTSWTEATLPSVPVEFYRVEFRLGSSSILVAASELGLLQSTDGGLTWQYRWQGSGYAWEHPATDLRIHPTNGLRMYAVAKGVGFLHSSDGGYSWGAVPGSSGLPTGSSWGRASLDISPDDPTTMAVIIGTTGDNLLGIFRTANAGTTWTNITGDLPDIGKTQMFHAQAIAFEPGNTDHIWAASVNLARTTDGGATWIQHYETGSTFEVGHADVTQLLFSDLSGSDLLWICNDGGLYRHDLSVPTTIGLNGNGSTGLRIAQVDQVEARRNLAVLGLHDDGELQSLDAGATWQYITNSTTGADGGAIAITDAEAHDFWCYWGVPWDLFRVLGGGTPVQVPVSASATLHYDPFDKRIYTPSGPTILTTGAYDASPTFTAAAVPALHPNPSYSIQAIFGSPADGKTIYASMRNSLKRDLGVARWTGSTWTVNTTLGLAPEDVIAPDGKTVYSRIITVAPSGEWPGEAWAGFSAAVDSPKVVHTTDYGVTWEDVSGELAACKTIYTIAPTPFDPRTLYAGTDIGVFRTTDGGQSWQPFQTGMPLGQVKDLEFVVDPGPSGNHLLVAGTYGRGVWTRDVSSRPIVYVDKTNAGTEDGSIEHPYNTVAEGVAAAPSGAVVAIRSNTYFEPQTVAGNLLLLTWAGTTQVR